MHDLAIEHIQHGRPADAQKLLLHAIQQNASDAQAFHLLAVSFAMQGQRERAESAFRKALQLRSNHALTWSNYARFQEQCGQLDNALHSLLKARHLDPRNIDYSLSIARILSDKGGYGAAIRELEHARGLKPNSSAVLYSLGTVLCLAGEHEQARRVLEDTLQIAPQHADSWAKLGGLHFQARRLEKAEHCLRQSLSINAAHQEARNFLAGSLLAAGRISEAIEQFRLLIRNPECTPSLYSNYLYALHFLDPPDLNQETQAAQEYNRRFTLKLTEDSSSGRNTSADDARAGRRRIRIGFMSPDFRVHSVAYFFEPLASGIDRRKFETFYFHCGNVNDNFTAKFKSYAEHWHDISKQDDDQAAAFIRDLQLDLLVDLAGHTGDNRLPIFTARVAPTQVTFLGYSGSTGLAEMDYLLTDALANPADSQRFCTEEIVTLPHSYFCYRPPQTAPDTQPLPADHNGFITFGSFNTRAKMSPSTIDAWIRILQSVPDSRLLLKNSSLTDAGVRRELMDRLRNAGISDNRLQFRERTENLEDHLKTYHEVDLALDTFPYNGATTTCEALWMGVPVVTLAGVTHVHRMGISILNAIGLSELVYDHVNRYVAGTIELAQQRDRLRSYRESMRDRLQASPLMDEAAYVLACEQVFQALIASRSGELCS